MLCFNLSLRQNEKDKKSIKCRSFKDLDIDKSKSDPKDSELFTTPPTTSTHWLCNTALLDKHAPSTEKSLNELRKTPWYTQDIHKEWQERRRLTRQWRKTRPSDEKCSRNVTRWVTLYTAQENDYHHNAIAEAGKGSKSLFWTFGQLINDAKTYPMPPGHSSKQIVNDFNQFFIDKIKSLKAQFTESTDHDNLDGEKIKQRLKYSYIMKCRVSKQPTYGQLKIKTTSRRNAASIWKWL